MSKLLILSGPTATGKTALAVKLAQKFNGELISADSRQIYREMDIGTGKDHPQNIPIHLIDIIDPSQAFSVAHYRNLALEKISQIQAKNKLPIIVGGTGQYIDSIVNPQPTFDIKPNKFLRFFLNRFSLKILQTIYKLLDKNSFNNLNNSDQNNPHRLIRKIEISLSPCPACPSGGRVKRRVGEGFDTLHVSLTAPNDFLYSRIDQRVEDRLKLGLINEIKNLLKKYKWSDPGLNCLAYKEFRDHFSVRASLAEAGEVWRFHEHAYARRQKTWFKKIPGVIFFDISRPNYQSKVNKLVTQWYNKS